MRVPQLNKWSTLEVALGEGGERNTSPNKRGALTLGCEGRHNLSFWLPPSEQLWVSHPLTPACPPAHTHPSHSPSGVWLSMPLSVWLRMSLTSSLVPPPPRVHKHVCIHSSTPTQSRPCFPSVILRSADSRAVPMQSASHWFLQWGGMGTGVLDVKWLQQTAWFGVGGVLVIWGSLPIGQLSKNQWCWC